MKKFFTGVLIALSIAMSGFATEQNVTRNGNNYTAQSVRRTSSSSKEKTQFTFTDTDNLVYDVYIIENGRCFIERVSKKSGKTYRKYLPEDVCKDICKELGREFTYVKKSKK